MSGSADRLGLFVGALLAALLLASLPGSARAQAPDRRAAYLGGGAAFGFEDFDGVPGGVDIDEAYFARVAKQPTRWEFKKGDVIWIPQNMVFQHFNTGATPLKLLGASNRLYRHMGYTEVDLENAPEWDAAQAGQREPVAARS